MRRQAAWGVLPTVAVAALLMALGSTPGRAQTAPPAAPGSAGAVPLRFVACPVYRDTVNARKSGCWLVTDPATGLRYDLQQAPTKPQLGQAVLVEAAVPATPQADVCGGIVLAPVRASVLAEACPATVIPAEGYPGKMFVLPGSVMTPNHLPQPQPQPPYVTQRFTIEFDFNDDYLRYQHAEVLLQTAVRLATRGRATRIQVTGHATTGASTVSGQRLAEGAGLARARAEMVAEALVRLGWPRDRMVVRWGDNAAPAADTAPALAEASRRRVDVEVVVP